MDLIGKSFINKFNSVYTVKEKVIKQVTDEYKDLIPQRLYEAMYDN